MTAQLIGFDAVVYSVLDLSQQNVLFAINFISDDFVVLRLVTGVRVPIRKQYYDICTHKERETECRFWIPAAKIMPFFKMNADQKSRKKKKSVEQTDAKKWKYKWDGVPFGRALCQWRCLDDWIEGGRTSSPLFSVQMRGHYMKSRNSKTQPHDQSCWEQVHCMIKISHIISLFGRFKRAKHQAGCSSSAIATFFIVPLISMAVRLAASFLFLRLFSVQY